MEIKIVKDILESNNVTAEENRKFFKEKKAVLINIMSSPGAGKTELLDATLGMLDGALRSAVVEGDICTTMDAERLTHRNVPLVQINTDTLGGVCHLEASMIREAVSKFDINDTDVVFVENVGNLVCPAEFDIGANLSVALLSSPEGPDKPLKYPLMFRTCPVVILSKMDIVEALGVDIDEYERNILKVNPTAKILRVSAKTGAGMDAWINVLKELHKTSAG